MAIYPQTAIYIITFFLTVGLFIYSWPRRQGTGGHYLLAHLVALAIWEIGLLFESISMTSEMKVFWSQICYLGFPFVVPFFFMFILEYINQKKLTSWLTWLIFFIPILIMAAAWTNQWHHLIWSSFEWGSLKYNLLIYHHGLLYFINVIYIYILVFYAFAVVIKNLRKSEPPFRSQLTILAISGVFPIVSGAMYALNICPLEGLDISSFGFLLTNVCLVLGLSRYQLLDLMPVAHDSVIKQFQDGMIVLDIKDRVVEINQNALKLLHLSNKSPLGEDYQTLFPWKIDLTKMALFHQPVEFCFDQDKKIFYDLLVSNLVDNHAAIVGRLLILRNVSYRKQTELQLKQANENLHYQINEINHLQEMLEEQATHDPLTNLHNRRLMDEMLSQQLLQSKQLERSYSIIVMDIDHFKVVNDEYGHQIGDQILQSLGKCILEFTRTSDFSCRLGGDEVLISFMNMPANKAQEKAEFIREKIAGLRTISDKKEIAITVSIGVSTFPDNAKTIKEMIYWADQAMYLAKDKGGNTVVLASDVKTV